MLLSLPVAASLATIDATNATLQLRCGGGREAVDAPMRVQVLGRFAVRTGEREVPPTDFGGRLSRRLLRLLAVRCGEVVTRDALTVALWPERAPSDPDANLNVLVSRVRHAVGERDLIETGDAGYALSGECVVDAARFVELASAGHAHLEAGRADVALRRLVQALQLWGEPLPEDAYEEWAQTHRRRLAAAHQQVLEDAAGAALALRDPSQAVDHARAALREQPLRDNAAALLVRALVESGDRAAALTEYEQFRHRLAEELGVDPSSAVQEVHGRILRDEITGPLTTSVPPRSPPLPTHLPFVGRDVQVSAIRAALAPPHRPVIITGASGAGKSRLLAEVERRSTVPTVATSAFVAERDRAWSMARTLLRETLSLDVEMTAILPGPARDALGGLLPELARKEGAARFDPGTVRSLRIEGAIRLLEAASEDGLLLLLDDLQWADASSLELLDIALSRVDALRPVLAFRPEEISDQHPVAVLREHLHASADVLELELGALPPSAVAEVAADPMLVAALVRGTDGTPLAVSEALNALASEGLVRFAVRRWRLVADAPRATVDAIVAAGQRRTIGLRIGRQSPGRRHLLSMLALIGREVPATLLAAALEREPGSVLEALDRLHAAQLARAGELGWRASHDLVAEVAAERVEPGLRTQLHAGIANALQEQRADPAELARHLAGAGERQRAAAAYGAAAQERLGECASQEARDLADTGLSLSPSHSDRAWLLELRAEARSRIDDLAGARADLREAIALWSAGPDRARSLARLAMVESGADDLSHAEELATRALTESRDDPRVRAHALSVAAIIDMNLGHEQRATARSDEALQLFSDIGDARGVADILDGRAMATFLDGHISEAVKAFDRVAGDFRDQGELLRVVTPRSTRGHGLLFMDRPDDALAETELALDLARTLGHAEGMSYAQWHRSEVLAGLTRADAAKAAASEALRIARRLGHRGWTATGLLALGTARAAAGRIGEAINTFEEALETAHGLPLFTSWAAARLGRLALDHGRLQDARCLGD